MGWREEQSMTKQEFLEKLRLALNGKVTSGQLVENLRYYEDYINTEIRKGREEEEVLSSLGDPRLIARTIVETKGGSSASWYEDAGQEGKEGDWEEEASAGGQGFDRQRDGMRLPVFFRIPLWGWLLIVLVILVLVLSLVFSVISALLPVLLPILLVLFLVKLFRDWIS